MPPVHSWSRILQYKMSLKDQVDSNTEEPEPVPTGILRVNDREGRKSSAQCGSDVVFFWRRAAIWRWKCCALDFLDSKLSVFMQQPCAQENHAGPATGS